MAMAPNETEVLLTQARSGSARALGALTELYRPMLLKLANDEVDSDLRTKVAPSDLVQDSIVAAIDGFGTFRGETANAFQGWLFAILQNQLVENVRRYRTQKRDVTLEQRTPELHETDEESVPGEIAEAREQVDRLLRGIEKLDEESQTVVQLRYIENRSFDSIGEQLQISHDAARRRWLSAIEELSRILHVKDS